MSRLNSFEFLSKEFPSTFQQEFRAIPNQNKIHIREGGTVIGQAFDQFFSRLSKPDQISQLAISLFWMLVSVVLSTLAVFFIWTLSRNKEMIMSHTQYLAYDTNKSTSSVSRVSTKSPREASRWPIKLTTPFNFTRTSEPSSWQPKITGPNFARDLLMYKNLYANSSNSSTGSMEQSTLRKLSMKITSGESLNRLTCIELYRK